MKMKVKSIRLLGKRWFQRTHGNTYHTVEIWIDNELIHKTERAYGYGSQYNQTAQDWLHDNGHLPGLEVYNFGGKEPLHCYCRRKNIAFVDQVIDVDRKKLL
jgi:hypothetical protein